ncbi:AAA family ATPase [Shewanella halifaxensis]|uniref:AAA family ATPase n=1 Tax=Shewanella halifaxensis TaxID=271098 RepID=UPI00157444F4|nr:AAA family ATPase [Shewanella halifaxensis]
MRITKLSLTNFRSFKATQTIDFAPVTLLFGPNSVGKSTVLMALFYLQQILSKGQCDPARIDALGGNLSVGLRTL